MSISTASTQSTGYVSDEQVSQFREEGFFVLESVIPTEHIQSLRDECQRFIDIADRRMDEAGVDRMELNHRGKRYFINNCAPQSPRIAEFVYSPLTEEICRACLGDDVYLFNDQYVTKSADVGMKFSWHQDSGYVGFPHRPYLSLWCALDDVSMENGTVYVLPFSKAGTREIVEHVRDAESNDLVGYHGDEPGVPVVAPAGSIAVFSSVSLHRSGPNTTPLMRRVYLAQYSAEPILEADSPHLKILAEAFIRRGQRIR